MTNFKPEELFDRLLRGHTLVTGNSRLARVLSAHYGQWQIKRGEQQWKNPLILPWNAWLNRVWEAAGLAGVEGTGRTVPNSRQLHNLWEQALAEAESAAGLLRPEAMAVQAMETRQLAVKWGLDLNDPAWRSEPGTDELTNSRAFSEWNQAFESSCQQGGWIPPEDRSALLLAAADAGTLALDGAIDLLGFDELTPAQQNLLTALEAGGVTVTHCRLEPARDRAVLWKARDLRDELRSMARWVRHCFENAPESSIAVVVPDLQSRRDEVERHLEAILTPGPRRNGRHSKPWNLSMGRPLARVPMVETAFDLLRLLNRRVDIQDVGRVLRTPWISGGTREKHSRALLEKCLRENYPRQLKTSELKYRAGELKKYGRDGVALAEHEWEPQPWNSPELARQMKLLIAFERDSGGRRSPSGWADAVESLLAGLGWPLALEQEGVKLPGAEHDLNWQAFQKWQDCLRELASLDVVSPSISRGEAIAQLQRICRERVFQPRTPPAGIQVLGLYEANGLRFDHLWVLGLHNDNWPPAARPNPFIPARLQQQAGLPHSSPQRELDVARTLTQRLLDTAAQAVFSYPGQVDGEDVIPSPLLTAHGLEQVSRPPLWKDLSWQDTVFAADGPDTIPLEPPGPLARPTARGGTSILRNQALCPFRAFATNRLGAEGLEKPVDGISGMLHGSLMHRVLERFWLQTRTQDGLLALEPDTLVAQLRGHIDHVLDDERGLRYRPEFRNVEASRLLRLALRYLELDRQRACFEVEGFEREILHEIEGETVRLIIDRVDRLEGGGQAIIDYKTGKVDPKKWFGERPEDPQLPLYAISADEAPDAVVFAVIRDDECLFSGVVNNEGLFPGLPPPPRQSTAELIEAGEDLQATTARWKVTLHRLMADFLAGEAAIDPKDGTRTCERSFCELQPLCRIGELQSLADAGGATGEPAP